MLPDGCMDLLWSEGRLYVAGPDTRAYVPEHPTARYAPGDAPALLGVPAHEMRDRRVDLAALEALALRRAADAPRPDPLLRAVVDGLNAGWTIARAADQAHLVRETRALAGTTLSACTASLAPLPAAGAAPVSRAAPASGAAPSSGAAPVSGPASAKRDTPQPSGSSTTA
ncbi:hypothetical protein GCM10010273_26640 [Streptomyces lavendulocolor]